MNRIPYMKDLIDHFQTDANIIAANLNKKILVFAEWNIEKLTRNYGNAIIIIPGVGDPISSVDRRTDCKANVEFEVEIGVQVQNPASTVQQFVIDGNPTSITGAFWDATLLEEIVRQSVVDFNKNKIQGKKYTQLVFKEAELPETSNDYLALKLMYKTTFIF